MGIVMSYGWYKLFHGIREAKYVISRQTPTTCHGSMYI